MSLFLNAWLPNVMKMTSGAYYVVVLKWRHLW